MKPLDGLTVLDFTQAFSGPYCTMNLADHGARIIKVERKDVGDQSRYWGPYTDDGYSGYFSIHNRNKESVSLDMSKPEGKDIIKKLYGVADIVVENFKFGTLDKLGLGYDVAKEINPRIIFASITGFGQTGSLRDNTCYDNIAESMSGFMEMTGFPELPPLRSGASVGDSFTGLTTAYAIALTYFNKLRTGKGNRLDVAMLDTMFTTIDDAILAYSLNGEIMSRSGNAKPAQLVPYDLYACRDGYFAVGVTGEDMWPAFCEALNMPELIKDPLYVTNDLRCKNFESFTALINNVFASKTKQEILEAFMSKNVPCAPCITPMETMEHPQILARDMLVEIEDKGIGKYQSFGIPVKFSKTPGEIRKCAPLLGEDTAKILSEIGYPDEEINTLAANGIIGI